MQHQFIYSGPLLLKIKISKKDIESIKQLFVKDKKLSHNKHLASIISTQYKIKKISHLVKILESYLKIFQRAYEHWYNKKISKIILKESWVNFMKAGECNPPHIHLGCNFSSVLYTDVPKELVKENSKYVNNGTKPGDITFNLCPHVDDHITEYYCLPEAGDFFIFPSKLVHSVNTFKSKGERVSVATNFVIE